MVYVIVLSLIASVSVLSLTKVGWKTSDTITEVDDGFPTEVVFAVSDAEESATVERMYYTKNSAIVLPKAPKKKNAEFLYWSLDGSNKATEEIIKEAIRNNTTGGIKLYPVYYSFNLTIEGDQFVLDGTEYTTHIIEQAEPGSSHSISFTGNNRFLCWVNISNNIVSNSKTYNFTVVNDTKLTALSVNSNSSPSVTVIFMNAYQQVMNYGSAKNESELTGLFPSNYPSKVGYTFKGWAIQEYNNQEASVENIWGYASVENVILHIVPIFTKNAGQYTVNVVLKDGDTLTDALTCSGNVGNKLVISKTQVANATGASVESIAYWSLDGTNPVVYKDKYTANYATEQVVTLYAVVASDVTEQPAVTITQMFAGMNGEKYQISTTMYYSIPANCTINEAGFVYGTSKTLFAGEDGESNLYLGGEKTYKNITSSTDKSLLYTFNGRIAKPNTAVFIKAFVTYLDKEGQPHTIYTKMYSGSYDSLTSGSES